MNPPWLRAWLGWALLRAGVAIAVIAWTGEWTISIVAWLILAAAHWESYEDHEVGRGRSRWR